MSERDVVVLGVLGALAYLEYRRRPPAERKEEVAEAPSLTEERAEEVAEAPSLVEERGEEVAEVERAPELVPEPRPPVETQPKGPIYVALPSPGAAPWLVAPQPPEMPEPEVPRFVPGYYLPQKAWVKWAGGYEPPLEFMLTKPDAYYVVHARAKERLAVPPVLTWVLKCDACEDLSRGEVPIYYDWVPILKVFRFNTCADMKYREPEVSSTWPPEPYCNYRVCVTWVSAW